MFREGQTVMRNAMAEGECRVIRSVDLVRTYLRHVVVREVAYTAEMR